MNRLIELIEDACREAGRLGLHDEATSLRKVLKDVRSHRDGVKHVHWPNGRQEVWSPDATASRPVR